MAAKGPLLLVALAAEFGLPAPALQPGTAATAAAAECAAPGGFATPDDADDAAFILMQSRLDFAGPRRSHALGGGTQHQARRRLRRCLRQRPDLEFLFPGDAGYDDSRRIHNFRVAHLVIPNVTVKATSREDVRLALLCSAENGLGALAASGMNSYEAFCTEGCVLILTAGMKSFRIDQVNRTAMLEPGLTQGEMYYHLYKEGRFALPGGTNSIVGLGGIAPGGGKGYASRLHGLLSDHMYKVEVMLYNGTVVNASEEQNSDLLWLCRGGGGMEIPGVVVAFHFNLVEAPGQVATLVLKWSLTEKLRSGTVVPFLEAWQTHLVANQDRRLHARLEPNARELQLTCYFLAGDAAEAFRAMAPFLAAPGVGAPDTMQFLELPWLDTVKNSSGLCSEPCPASSPSGCVADEALLSSHSLPEGCGYGRSFTTPQKQRALVFQEPLARTGLERLVVAFSTPPVGAYGGLYLQIDPTNGKASELPANATAYRWRSPASMTMQLVVMWEDNVTSNPTLEKYSFDFAYNLSAFAEGGASYVNYLDRDVPGAEDPKRAYWGENWQKVLSVMRHYTTGAVTAGRWLTD